jgi:hypothetical protein
LAGATDDDKTLTSLAEQANASAVVAMMNKRRSAVFICVSG